MPEGAFNRRSAAVKVRCHGPAAATRAAPMKSSAMVTGNQRATSATPSYQTVSPER
jgi:hypothetical protein